MNNWWGQLGWAHKTYPIPNDTIGFHYIESLDRSGYVTKIWKSSICEFEFTKLMVISCFDSGLYEKDSSQTGVVWNFESLMIVWSLLWLVLCLTCFLVNYSMSLLNWLVIHGLDWLWYVCITKNGRQIGFIWSSCDCVITSMISSMPYFLPCQLKYEFTKLVGNTWTWLTLVRVYHNE